MKHPETKEIHSLAIVAGKSGGHLIPGMIYARNVSRLNQNCRVIFFSTDTKLDRSIIALYPYVFKFIPLPLISVPGKKFWRYPLFFFQFIKAFLTALFALRRTHPESVMSMGGYISLPICYAARFLKIPYDLFALDAVPGKAIEWLAPHARTLYLCFPSAAHYFKRKTELTSYPLRFDAENLISRASALMQLGLDPSKKTLLILGGSQGSQSLNHSVREIFKTHPECATAVQIIHQTGAGNDAALKEFYQQHGISALVFDYLHDLNYAYAAADFVIARAGAGTIFELLFFEKKTVLIPLEVASTSHQLDNAQSIVHMRPDLFTLMRQADGESHPEKLYRLILEALAL